MFISSSETGTEWCYNISIINDGRLERNKRSVITLFSSDSAVTLQNNFLVMEILEAESKTILMHCINVIFL